MLECPPENTGRWWDPLEEMKAYVASSHVTVRDEICACLKLWLIKHSVEECHWITARRKWNIITADVDGSNHSHAEDFIFISLFSYARLAAWLITCKSDNVPRQPQLCFLFNAV